MTHTSGDAVTFLPGGMWKMPRPTRLADPMRKSDVTCPKCQAGYRRIELTSKIGVEGEFRCLVCDQVLELLDGSTEVALRLTVQPSMTLHTC